MQICTCLLESAVSKNYVLLRILIPPPLVLSFVSGATLVFWILLCLVNPSASVFHVFMKSELQ